MRKCHTSHFIALTVLILLVQFTLNYYQRNGTEDRNSIGPVTCPDISYSIEVPAQNHYTLFILILSSIENVQRRNAIRETWLNPQQKLSVVEYKFVVGNRNDLELQEQLESEQKLHKDILVFQDIMDNFDMLTHKVIETFKWVNKNIKMDFLLKCDDDSFVLIDALLETIREENLPTTRFYWGYFRGRSLIKRTGKWAEQDWNLCDKYLPFAFGGGYVLSSDLVTYIVTNSHYLKLFRNEDVTVGAWLSPLAVTRKHDNRFNTESESRGCSNTYLVSHRETPDSMREKYRLYLQTGNSCSEEFNTIPGYIYNWNVLPSYCCHRLQGLD